MAEVPPPPNPYKILSKTYQSSLRWTPGYLDRITIDDKRYQFYQDKVQATVQPQKTPSSSTREVKRMGDKFFYIHRNIPVEQQYNRTSLKRSEVRPWDELVDRPLMSTKVRDKEVRLPYPQEHPYSSHIPHYLTFPDPYPHPPNPRTNPPLTPKIAQRPQSAGIANQATPPPLIKAASPDIESGKVEGDSAEEEKEDEKSKEMMSQLEGFRAAEVTTDGRYPCNPPRKNYVSRKAYDFGTRVEVLDLNDMGGRTPGMEHLLWQMPKGFPRERCITYPTPSQQFSRQPTTPNYLQLPSSYHLPSSSPSTPAYHNYPHHVQSAVADFHRTMCRTTSYTDHFPAHSLPPSRGFDRTLRSVSSFRPFTSEQRGKYHFNTGSGLMTPRPGTQPMPPPPELRSDGERQGACFDDERLSMGGNEDAIVIDENEGGRDVVDIMNSKDGAGKDDNAKSSAAYKIRERRDGSGTVLCSPLHLSGDIRRKPRPKSCSSKISPASRVMTMQHKFPPLEDKSLRFPIIANSFQTPPTDHSQQMAYMKLGPPSTRNYGEMVTSPCIRVKRNHAHHSSLPVPRLLSQSMAYMQPQGVQKLQSHAQVVKQFTRNLQRELYSSPDMRGVTMKEGKKHEFYGHHGYDFH